MFYDINLIKFACAIAEWLGSMKLIIHDAKDIEKDEWTKNKKQNK